MLLRTLDKYMPSMQLECRQRCMLNMPSTGMQVKHLVSVLALPLRRRKPVRRRKSAKLDVDYYYFFLLIFFFLIN